MHSIKYEIDKLETININRSIKCNLQLHFNIPTEILLTENINCIEHYLYNIELEEILVDNLIGLS
jgi:hypothetical protein